MHKRWHTVLGACVVFGFCWLSLSDHNPSPFSPYSLAVVIPAIVVGIYLGSGPFSVAFSALPVVIIYLAVTLQSRPRPEISKISTSIAMLVALSSLVIGVLAFESGVRYQGLAHTLVINVYNIAFALIVAMLFLRNRRAPSVDTAWAFNVVLFSWIGYSAFPVLGESF